MVQDQEEKTQLVQETPVSYSSHEDVSKSSSPQQPVDIHTAVDMAGCGMGTILIATACFFLLSFEGSEIMILSVVGLIVKCEWELSPFLVSLLQMNVLVSMGLAAILTSSLPDRYGRKPMLVVGAVAMTVFGLLCAHSQGYWELFVWRFLVGASCGLMLSPAISYLAEMSQTRYRAHAVVGVSLAWGIGTFISCTIAYLTLGEFGWRGYVLANAIVFGLSIPFTLIIPESVRFTMLTRRRPDLAEKTLRRLFRWNFKTYPDIKLVFEVTGSEENGSKETGFTETGSKETCSEETGSEVPNEGEVLPPEIPSAEKMSTTEGHDLFQETLRQPQHIWNMVLFTVLAFSNIAVYYVSGFATPRFVNEGYCIQENSIGDLSETNTTDTGCHFSNQTLLNLMLITFVEPVGVLITLGLVSTIGRRKSGFLVSIVTLVTLSALYFCVGPTYLHWTLTVYKGSSAGLSFIPFLMCTEYFPTVIRGFASSLLVASGRVGGTVGIFLVQGIFGWSPQLLIGVTQAMTLVTMVMFILLRKETMGTKLG